MTAIRVLNGSYRNKPVINQEFTLVKGFQTGKKGSYITVKNEGQFEVNIPEVKIKVDTIDCVEFTNGEVVLNTTKSKAPKNVVSYIDETTTETAKIAQPDETDEEAMDRIAKRFSILDRMTVATIAGDIRAMIVSGPPGVGKSFGVETQMEKHSLFDQLAGRKVRYEVVKGALTALGLYAQLYKFSDARNVLIFDDADGIFADELSLNILKAALDSGKRRRIFWNSDSAMLRREGIPDQFDFKGAVIFITNLSFENTRSKKMQEHLLALQSRCHYIDLTINTERDKMVRIKQVHRDASKDDNEGLFAGYGFQNGEDQSILDFMWENRTKMRELSLRMALKIADLAKIDPDNWKSLAENTCMRR